MKHYLLTWYGITDLRAALGIEGDGGPVLGALKTGDYTDVMILAYTDPSKSGKGVEDYHAKWKTWLATESADRNSISRAQEFEIVDAVVNTAAAHQLFKVWIRTELEKLGISVNVRLCVKELVSLNDSKGIYDAAVNALDLVSKETGERRLTCYLSPGTPVMAFTWAFVALTNPELDIQVLSSSEPRKPPAVVALPYDLLAPSNRRLKQFSKGEVPEFDIIFHLFGEQRMAPLLGVMQFPAERHIFVTSDQYSSESMKQFMAEGAWSEISVNPFDPMSTKLQILKAVASLPPETRVGFNLTGGTKLMFAGAIAACRKVDGVPFYFETKEHSLVFLHDFSRMAIRGIDEVDAFFLVNGFAVVSGGRWTDNPCRQQRISLTNRLWKDRSLIAKVYKHLAIYADYESDQFIPFQLDETVFNRGKRASIKIELDRNGKAYLNLDGTEFEFEHSPEFAKYLAGQWLEEYVFLILEPLLERGTIRDLRIGFDVTWGGTSAGEDGPIQEFDVVFTEGRRLFIVECKAGAVRSEHVYKLQQCVRGYGGIDARGIMACAFPLHSPLTRKRLETASNISGFYGWDITNDLAEQIISESSSCL